MCGRSRHLRATPTRGKVVRTATSESWRKCYCVGVRALWVLLMGTALGAQTLENASLVRGVLLECDAKPAGELSIRTADNQVLRYQFDRKTYDEREDRLIEASKLVAGEQVEVV